MAKAKVVRKMFASELIMAVKKLLEARKQASFVAFLYNIDCRIAKDPQSKDLAKLEQESESHTVYLAFRAHYDNNGVTLCVPVRVLRRKASNRYYLDQPLVKYNGTWLDFSEFLDEVIANSLLHVPTGDNGYKALLCWYDYRKKHFTFMQLPKELRLMIYEFAIGNDVYPIVKKVAEDKTVPNLGNGWKPKAPEILLIGTHDEADEIAAPNTALLRVSRQVGKEVCSVMWGSNRKSFATMDDIWPFKARTKLLPTSALKHVGLNFSNEEYLEFFGAKLELGGILQRPQIVGAMILRGGCLPMLDQLDIKFRSTCWEPLTSPWTTVVRRALEDDGETWDRAWASDFACQKILTTMILTLAMEHVKHIKTVTLEGYIKASTKQQFCQALKALKEVPGQTSNWPMTVSGVMSLDQPPRCQCNTRCGFWGVKKLFDPRSRCHHSRDPSLAQMFKNYKFDLED